jgi:hypothetical protein
MLRQAGMSTAQALEALGPALDQMLKDPSKFAGTAAEPLLQMAAFAKANAGLMDFIDGLGQTASALAGFGLFTQDIATKMSADMGAAIDKMIAAGLTYEQALALSAQDLYDLDQAAQRSGVQLDAHTQKLIDDAKAAGLFEGLEDPMKKLVDVSNQMLIATAELVKLFGGRVPDSVQKMIDEFNKVKAPNTAPPPDQTQNDQNDQNRNRNRNGYASGTGGLRDFGSSTVTTLHGVEAVVTADEYSAMQGGAQAAATAAQLSSLVANLPGMMTRAMTHAMLKSAVSVRG